MRAGRPSRYWSFENEALLVPAVEMLVKLGSCLAACIGYSSKNPSDPEQPHIIHWKGQNTGYHGTTTERPATTPRRAQECHKSKTPHSHFMPHLRPALSPRLPGKGQGEGDFLLPSLSSPLEQMSTPLCGPPLPLYDNESHSGRNLASLSSVYRPLDPRARVASCQPRIGIQVGQQLVRRSTKIVLSTPLRRELHDLSRVLSAGDGQ